MTRQVEGGTGQGNQNDLILHFGLGGYHGDVSLEVTWPDGTVRTSNAPANTVQTILLNDAPTVPTDLSVSDFRTDGAMISWNPSTDLDGDRLTYEVQFRKDDLSDSWSSSLEHTVPLKPLVVPTATFASTGPRTGLWGLENIIINHVNTFNIDQGTSGNPDDDDDPFNDTGLGLIGYTGGVRSARVPVPSNSAGIPSSPLLYNFQTPSPTFYTGHVENKPNSMWLGNRGNVIGQWIEIELNDVTELEQMWIWNWNDKPEVGRQVNSFDIQISTTTTAPGQLGHVTWDTSFTNDFSETTGGGVADRPVDFIQSFPAGTETRYLRINNMHHVGPAVGGNNYIGLGPVFIFEAPEKPFVTLTGLEPETTYRARIRTTDGEKMSDWFEKNHLFTTLPILPTRAIGEVGKITNLTHTMQTVVLGRTYQNPVVFAQSLTNSGTDPAVTRVTNVEPDRFTIYLAEPSNENGLHNALETVTYVVLEAGIHQLADGTQLEVGTVTTSASVGQLVSNEWNPLNFSTDFHSPPVLLSQIQTDGGATYLQTRQNNITSSGAEIALEQEEEVHTQHSSETIGYLAIEEGIGQWNGMLIEAFNTPAQVTDAWYEHQLERTYETSPALLSSLTSYHGKNNSHIRYQNLGNSSVQFKIGEDTTHDTETAHGGESVAYLAIGGIGSLTAVAPQMPVGEVGILTDMTHVEQTIVLKNTYIHPVVFAQSPTIVGNDPIVVRVTNVQSDRFTLYLTEPSNENGLHNANETVTYLVLETGHHELTNGTLFEVGTITTDATVGQLIPNQWELINFASHFTEAPVVLSQVQSAAGQVFLKTRHNQITPSGFDLALEQEELVGMQHPSETVGYLAIRQGSGTWNGMLFEADRTASVVTDQWYTQDFEIAYGSAPHFLSSLTTYNSSDNAQVRYTNLDGSTVQLKVEEDTTRDMETEHVAESIAYLAILGSGSLTANVSNPRLLSVERNEGRETYDKLETMAFIFNQDVQVSRDDLRLSSTDAGNLPLDLQDVTFNYDTLLRRATWNFTALSEFSGFYSAVLIGENITNQNGQPLDGDGDGNGGDDYQHSFIVARRGDSNLDGKIDISDFHTMVLQFDPHGFNSSHTWQQGNADHDSDIDITDIFQLVRNFAPLGYGTFHVPASIAQSVLREMAERHSRMDSFGFPDAYGQMNQRLDQPVLEPVKTTVDFDQRSDILLGIDVVFHPRRRYYKFNVADMVFAGFATTGRDPAIQDSALLVHKPV